MRVIDYESSPTKRMSPAIFWLVIGVLAVVEIVIVSFVIYAGAAEYGGTFIVVNLLFWGTPCAIGILVMCRAHFRARNR